MDKLEALNSLEIVDSSICGDEVEYVCAEISAANIKILLDAGFTTEQIDEAMGDDKTDIDLATLAFNYADAVWWDSKKGFIHEQAGETEAAERPEIICLCGSTKFKDAFIKATEDLTLEGKIVLSVGCFGHADNKFGTVITNDIKDKLDTLHKRKIDLADRVLVLNVGGYIGDSTRSEVKYARALGKPIEFLESGQEAGKEENR